MNRKKRGNSLKKVDFTSDEQLCIESIESILEMEEYLFREDYAYLRWPVVQLYCNQVIVVLGTFILNPLYRSVSYGVIFLAFSMYNLEKWTKNLTLGPFLA